MWARFTLLFTFKFIIFLNCWLVSTYVVCERLSVMHKQVSGWTVNFCPNSPESPFPEFQTRKPPLPHFAKTSDLRWPKFTPEYSPISENFRFGMTKVYYGISPPPTFRKTSDLGWPKFTPEYPPHFRKLQIWDDQSLLQNTPPQMKIVRESKSESFRIPRVTTCGDFIQPG